VTSNEARELVLLPSREKLRVQWLLAIVAAICFVGFGLLDFIDGRYVDGALFVFLSVAGLVYPYAVTHRRQIILSADMIILRDLVRIRSVDRSAVQSIRSTVYGVAFRGSRLGRHGVVAVVGNCWEGDDLARLASRLAVPLDR
jgi:hypothetical protein